MIVEFTNSAVKDLKRLPEHIVTKLRDWANAVQRVGIEAVRRSLGTMTSRFVGHEMVKGLFVYQRHTGLFMLKINGVMFEL